MNNKGVRKHNTHGGKTMRSIMKCLKPEVVAKLHQEHVRRIEFVDAEKFELIKKKVGRELFRRNGVVPTEEFLDGMIFALKQYYVIPILDPANAHAISVVVDDAWHMHILDTAGYSRFCEVVVGEIMPHVHLDFDSPEQVENVRTLYAYTLEILQKVFMEVDARFWPYDFTLENLICFHQGNSESYAELQPHRLFEPDPRGEMLRV